MLSTILLFRTHCIENSLVKQGLLMFYYQGMVVGLNVKLVLTFFKHSIQEVKDFAVRVIRDCSPIMSAVKGVRGVWQMLTKADKGG